ncbi:MAG TPA: hypothetical protein VHE30_05850 [Polyangiaceae bacterium]|nr:hypothetical protein [Polyangiaceae bacterium]
MVYDRAPLALSVLALMATCVFSGRLHAFFVRHAGQIGYDDGYILSLGERLIDGHFLPYVDGCSQRGPVLYWAAALAQLATGRFGWQGGRLLSIVTTFATLFSVFAVGIVAKRPAGGALAAVFVAWFVLVGFAPSPGFALTGEGVLSPFAVESLLWVTFAVSPGRRTRARRAGLVAAGAFSALAGFSKQTALPMILPIALFGFAGLWTTSEDRKERWIGLGALAGGFVGTIALMLLPYAIRGELRAFWYWFYEYNSQTYMAPYKNVHTVDAFVGFMWDHTFAVAGFAFIVSSAIARPFSRAKSFPRGFLRAYAEAGVDCTAALVGLALFVSAVVALRFWPHYFLGVVPFAGLLVGFRAEEAISGGGKTGSFLGTLVLLGLVTGFLGFSSENKLAQFERDAKRGGWAPLRHEAVCDVIDRFSKPGESLFVWGFNPDLYLTCRRRPATRFLFLLPVAGTVVPQWNVVREDLVARGSREQLIQDLTAANPPVVIDGDSPQWGISLTRVPVVRNWVEARYCLQKDRQKTILAGKVGVWVRKDRSDCRC